MRPSFSARPSPSLRCPTRPGPLRSAEPVVDAQQPCLPSKPPEPVSRSRPLAYSPAEAARRRERCRPRHRQLRDGKLACCWAPTTTARRPTGQCLLVARGKQSLILRALLPAGRPIFFDVWRQTNNAPPSETSSHNEHSAPGRRSRQRPAVAVYRDDPLRSCPFQPRTDPASTSSWPPPSPSRTKDQRPLRPNSTQSLCRQD